jgi:hypothetical protein
MPSVISTNIIAWLGKRMGILPKQVPPKNPFCIISRRAD